MSTAPLFPLAPPPGVIGAALTPFHEARRGGQTVDLERLLEELAMLADHCDAISVLGAEVSEYRVLPPAVRREVLREAIVSVAGSVPTIAGASSPSPSEVVELAEIAAEAGAQYIQVLIPRAAAGTTPTERDLVAYFEAVTARSPLPVVAYHNPPTGADPSSSALIELAQLDGIVAFKESSRDINKIGLLIQEIELAGHARYYTTMQALLPTLMLGGSGAMMPPPGTLIGAQVYEAFARGDLSTAARWQGCFRTYPTTWGRHGLGAVSKAAMRAIGFDLGDPAWPGQPVPASECSALEQTLRKVGAADLLRGNTSAKVS